MIDFHNEPWSDAEKRETVERLLEKFAAVLPDVARWLKPRNPIGQTRQIRRSRTA